MCFLFVFQAEDGIRDYKVTGVQTCALPICPGLYQVRVAARDALSGRVGTAKSWIQIPDLSAKKLTLSSLRSEEHTSELQSPCNLVCCLLLEKNKRFESRV